jgi:hypothetical protein
VAHNRRFPATIMLSEVHAEVFAMRVKRDASAASARSVVPDARGHTGEERGASDGVRLVGDY